MRALKVATTSLFGLGFIMLAGMPWLLHAQPSRTAADLERSRFALWLTLYAMALLLVFFAICVLSWRIVVRQRQEFRAQSEANLRDLIEGTLADHERKQLSSEDSNG